MMRKLLNLLIFCLSFSWFYLIVSSEGELYVIYEEGTSVYLYNVTLFTTSDPLRRFNGVEGRFFVDLDGNTDSGLNPNNYIPLDQRSNNINFNESYMFLLSARYPLESINSIYIKWTGDYDENTTITNSRKVYIDRIVLQLVTDKTPIPTKIYCAYNETSVALEVDKGELMESCSLGPLNRISWLNFDKPSKINANYIPLNILQP